MRSPLALALALLAAALPALGLAADAPPAAPPQAPAQPPPQPRIQPALPGTCAPLPRTRAGPLPFSAGERLSYEVDVMGAKAGKMSFEVLPLARKTGEIPIRVRAESNTLFTKMRKTKGEVLSFLRPGDLKPNRFHEDLVEGNTTRIADVSFGGDKIARVQWKSNNNRTGANRLAHVGDALDYVGGVYLFRGIPLKIGDSFCFDAYAMKRMWRVEGRVEAREHVSTPAGEFDAFHLSGVATPFSGKAKKREIHFWISDDARRLPLAALGVLELGPVRATLVDVQRPDMKTPPREKPLEW